MAHNSKLLTKPLESRLTSDPSFKARIINPPDKFCNRVDRKTLQSNMQVNYKYLMNSIGEVFAMTSVLIFLSQNYLGKWHQASFLRFVKRFLATPPIFSFVGLSRPLPICQNFFSKSAKTQVTCSSA